MQLTVTSIEKHFINILEYIFFLEKTNISNIKYLEEVLYTSYRFGRCKDKNKRRKIIIPDFYNNLDVNFNGNIISTKFEIGLKSNKDLIKLLTTNSCGNPQEKVLSIITLIHEDKNVLLEFVDASKKYVEHFNKEFMKKTSETNRIYCWNDYWSLFSKTPTRNSDTIYLKENVFEDLCDDITDFLSTDTQSEYINYGIPYKKVYLLYGKPGSGKTSTINAIASKFNSDIFVLPLSNEITDTTFIEAIGGIYRSDDDNINNNNNKILVLEDIDCLFEERKQGDNNKTNISLQSLLNTLDGFTTLDGTITFVTANNVDSLDEAMVRCCRIDKCIHYDYADKYQTYSILEKYLPNNKEIYGKIYKSIQHKKYTIAMLQRFLFENRNNNNIIDNLKQLHEIIDTNIKTINNALYN